LNVNSFSGLYSKIIQETAVLLAEQDLIDFLGSDVHNARHVERLSKSIQHPAVQRLLTNGNLLNASL